EKEQEREEQLMEDKKRKKDEKKKKETAQKVTEQKTKVPEATKPSLSQPPGAVPIGTAPAPPVNGGNNAKRAAVPNGQPPSTARYMPREVPPRFRCQQDQKVLLKRGQALPPSCMLLGGGGAGPTPSVPGANPSNNNAHQVPTAALQGDYGTTGHTTEGRAAASNYANSTWSPGGPSSSPSAAANPTHGWDKVIVDGSDMEEWPCIASKEAESSPSSETTDDNNSASTPGSEKTAAPGCNAGGKGKAANLCQTGSAGNECTLGAWNSGLKPKAVQSSNSAPAEGNSGLGNWKNLSGQDRTGPGSGSSNFNPNTNPSAWPALVQEGCSKKGASESESGNSNPQPGTAAGQASREQLSKTDNAGVTWSASSREQAQTANTDGPKSGNTNSTNLSSPNPMENKGIPFGLGLANPARSTDAPSQSTGDRKGGGIGSWNAARGSSTADAISGQTSSGNAGNSGRGREDSWKAGSSQKPNGSRIDSWDGASRPAGSGSWNLGTQDSNENKHWGEGNKTVSGVSQGVWKQPSAPEELTIGEWSGSNQPNSSTGAWDNQKGHFLPESQGSSQAPCWGRSSSSAGSEVGGQSTGSNHKTGSTDSHASGRRPSRPVSSDPQVALQSFLSRTDLDPRVLSNSGWGQTQIKQNTTWDDLPPKSIGKSDKGTEGWESNTTQTKNSGGWGDPPGQSNQAKSGWSDPSTPTEWKDSKSEGNWSEYKNNPSWGGGGRQEERTSSSWNDGTSSSKDQGWSGRPANHGWASGKNGWGDDTNQPKSAGWDNPGGKPAPSWGESGQNEIGTRGGGANGAPGPRSGWEDPSRSQSWGEPPKQANSWNKQQPPPPLQQQEAPGSWGPPSGSGSSGSGLPNTSWSSGPMPTPVVSKDEEPSGWEEPSPQSISRKMDIDDGTSAWGDPSSYNYKNVNLWDKNSQGTPPVSRDQNLGGTMPSKAASSGVVWNESTPPSQAVDNGTDVWGKPTKVNAEWGDSENTTASTTGGWGNSPANPTNAIQTGSKSMQDGWVDSDSSVAGTRHSSWEEEEEGGVWNSAGSQGSGSSYSSANWGQGGKKPQNKGSLKGGSGDAWMNPLSKQFSNMGLLSQADDTTNNKLDLSVDKKLDSDKRAMNLGDYNGIIRKERSGFRPPNSKDMGPADSGPYYEKGGAQRSPIQSDEQFLTNTTPQLTLPFSNQDGCLGDEVPCSPCSPFSPTPSYKLSPSGSTLPNIGLGAIGSGLNPQNFSVRQHAPGAPQFSWPACQLFLQQQQQQQQQQQLLNQRKISQAVRQQQEQQQLARMVSALQQQRQSAMKHSPSQSGSKQHLDSMVPNALNMGLSDLQTKGQIPGYSPGLAPNLNLNPLDFNSMVGGKDVSGQQSRFKQWTSMMDGLPQPSSPQDPSMHKNGNRGGPGKETHTTFAGPITIIISGTLGPKSFLDLCSRHVKLLLNKPQLTPGPPRIYPALLFTGFGNVTPLSGAVVPPGKILGGSMASPGLDTDHQLLRDNTESSSSLTTSLPSPGAWPYTASESSFSNVPSTSAKFNDLKSTWSLDPIGHNPTSHKMWRNPTSSRSTTSLPRPPPGLTNQKHPSSSPWSSVATRVTRGWGGQDTRYPPGSAWSDAGAVRASCWLVLHNLTPQVSHLFISNPTTATICAKKKPVFSFSCSTENGVMLQFCDTKIKEILSPDPLHRCVLGNTTILAEFAPEDEVNRYFAQAPTPPTPSGPSTGWQTLETGQSQPDPVGQGLNLFGGSTGLGQWSSGSGGRPAVGGTGGADLPGESLWGAPSYTSSLWGAPTVEDSHQMGSPASLLPGDLLGGGSDSI
uniref:Trinucleotide repeat containing adaptor 6B n=1 Tax=Latimeria chalumnae TaxID=7897 RepID=H2ZTI1_LATCH